MLHLLLALCALASPGRAQEPARASEDLTSLGLDELIRRLPRIGREHEELPSGEWELESVSAEMQRRIEGGAQLTAEQWLAALRTTGALRTRARWPASEPYAISMRDPGWLPYTAVHLLSRVEGLADAEAGWRVPSSCGTYSMAQERAWLYQPLGSLTEGRHALAYHLALERGERRRQVGAKTAPPAGIFFRGEIALDVEVVETVEQAVPPRSGPELDALVRRSLSLAVHEWGDGRSALVFLDPDVALPELRTLALSLDVELLRGDAVVESARLWASSDDPLLVGSSVHARPGQTFTFAVLEALPVAVESDAATRAEWSLRVRGTSKDVLPLWDADSFWSGELRIPLEELIARERELAPEGRGPLFYMPTFR